MRKKISTPKIHAELGSYSHVIEDGAGTVYISGQVPVDSDGVTVDPGDPAAQAEQVMANLVGALEGAGLTPQDVVKLTAYLTKREYAASYASARSNAFEAPFPASSVVIVPELLDSEWCLEVEAIAHRSG